MKLSTRRTIRGWLLDFPDETLHAALVASAGIAALGALTETGAVLAGGLLGIVGTAYINGQTSYDACPNCRSEVSALGDRYCSTCGARLDDLEAAPPIDERVAERHRPVGLTEIERSPPPATIADGGEMDESEQREVAS